jgi:hypothetical protein
MRISRDIIFDLTKEDFYVDQITSESLCSRIVYGIVDIILNVENKKELSRLKSNFFQANNLLLALLLQGGVQIDWKLFKERLLCDQCLYCSRKLKLNREIQVITIHFFCSDDHCNSFYDTNKKHSGSLINQLREIKKRVSEEQDQAKTKELVNSFSKKFVKKITSQQPQEIAQEIVPDKIFRRIFKHLDVQSINQFIEEHLSEHERYIKTNTRSKITYLDRAALLDCITDEYIDFINNKRNKKAINVHQYFYSANIFLIVRELFKSRLYPNQGLELDLGFPNQEIRDKYHLPY